MQLSPGVPIRRFSYLFVLVPVLKFWNSNHFLPHWEWSAGKIEEWIYTGRNKIMIGLPIFLCPNILRIENAVGWHNCSLKGIDVSEPHHSTGVKSCMIQESLHVQVHVTLYSCSVGTGLSYQSGGSNIFHLCFLVVGKFYSPTAILK